ncbi:uncharacterized protein PFL1_05004 [Pseudozyma flocculosa PF-1]|uniref:DUF572-domain-containing protein n=2 Tax=Pseudozyma flocculosa TaxID=84751 RepID=A0A5C3EUW0_9BASI|nr:uncharacterized protein PFL1_05004 [Pseudozyma flocculosa PF-1]EPQ27466.1 hypothetical protein PFL1_05004 [Pseudozyma flocculosa PF-1]SPO36104.1 uncharacterized protein PSFLO_01575 [Pseudozyma flocculosa]
MQGFGMGRYRPPDADPTKQSFNQGRHPLGVRARKIDQGILVVRFELPFNIWCAGCDNHIGQGVRYNAEKRHVGDYYSTKIWAFRCKCHLCSKWFEIRTDPKNARYIVQEGARQQNQEWDPEENGGHPIYDESAAAGPSKPLDAFSQLEKRESDRDKALRLTDRVLELEEHSEARWSDPYTLNAKLRSSFRKDKRVRTDKLIRDLELKERIGWREDAVLADDHTPSSTTPRDPANGRLEAGAQWQDARLAMQAERLGRGAKALEGPAPSTARSGGQRQSTSSLGKASPSSSSSRKTSTASKPRKTASSAAAGTNAKAKASAVEALRRQLIANTRKKQDPFLQQLDRHVAQRR